MEYKCPQCGIKMEPVFCECREVAGIHCSYQGGEMIHSRCGKRVPDAVRKSFEEWQEKERSKRNEN